MMHQTSIMKRIQEREYFNKPNTFYNYPDMFQIVALFEECLMDDQFLRNLYKEVIQAMWAFRVQHFRVCEKELIETHKRWNECLKYPCKFFKIETFYNTETRIPDVTTFGFVRSLDYHTIHLNISPEVFDHLTEAEVFSSLEATFLHELTHVFQCLFGKIRKMDTPDVPYRQRWHEQEARFVAEYVSRNRLFKIRNRGEFFPAV